MQTVKSFYFTIYPAGDVDHPVDAIKLHTAKAIADKPLTILFAVWTPETMQLEVSYGETGNLENYDYDLIDMTPALLTKHVLFSEDDSSVEFMFNGLISSYIYDGKYFEKIKANRLNNLKTN